MPKIQGVPAGREQFRQMPDLQMFKFAEAKLSEGMITMLDSADIPPGSLQLARNATVRFDRTSRRAGSILLEPVKPDANPVLRLAFMKKQDGTGYTVRMTPASLHTLGIGTWNAIVDSNVVGQTLIGTVADRFQTAVVLDEFVFSNNGANEIQKVDFTANTFAKLGNAPKYRYIAGIFNRVVGAARRDVNEVEIGWSADALIDQWDFNINNTAGSTPLIDSPADLSDFITGLFAANNVLIVLREKSLWVGSKQPIPQNPFYFQNVIPGIGCDCPSSAILIGDAIAWLDQRTGTVYTYTPGGQLEPIGRPIEKSILQNVDDPNLIFAGYDSINNEYSICIPAVGTNDVNVWTYNRRNKAWTRNEYYKLTAFNETDLAIASTTIDQLGDVAIEDLVGTIDSLSPSYAIIPVQVFGRDDGTIATAKVDAALDAPHTDFPLGIPYETELVSKTFVIPENDIYIAQINIEYVSKTGGEFTVWYSRSGGAIDDWVLAKTVTVTILEIPKLLTLRKVIKCRRFAWRIRTSGGLFEVLSYEVHAYPSGKSSK